MSNLNGFSAELKAVSLKLDALIAKLIPPWQRLLPAHRNT
jgi:hypothetical protein